MKILLILVPGKTFRKAAAEGRPHRSYAATTLLQLCALVPHELHAEIKILDLSIGPLPEDFHADIVGISTWTCGAPEAYRIADRARQQGIKVVLGGAHPTLMPEEAAWHADAVVIGHGEFSWPQLLRDYAGNRLRKFYCDDTSPFSAPLPPLNRRLLDRRRYYFTNCLEATRGCPNTCRFCVVRGMSRGCCWTRDVREVVAEIETMGRRVAFLDSSITEFTSYAEKLWQELIPLNIRWYSSATVRFAEDERAVRLAAKSGCRGVLIGFESINQEALAGTGKSINMVRRYRDAIQRLHDCGIMILGCFVFGFDEDDASVFERTVEFVTGVGIDLARYAILTPFPGTPLHEKLCKEQRIRSRDWNHYDTENAVFEPARMSARKLEEGWRWAYRETYRCSSILKRVVRKGSPLLLSVPANLLFRKIAREFNVAGN